MPGGFAALDTGFPDLSGMQSADRQIEAIRDYLCQLLEQLRYALHNLSAENFNTTEVTGWLGEVIEEPVRIAIDRVADGLAARLDLDESRLTTLFTRTGVNELGQNESLYSRITQTAGDLTAEVGKKQDSATLITTINQSAEKIASAAVKTDERGGTLASYITQTAAELASRVTGAQMHSAISQSAGGVLLSVRGEYADEWTEGAAYYASDVVKVTASSGGAVTAVSFYRAKTDHTAAQANRPPSAAYWDAVDAPNVQTLIDANLSGITLSYDNTGLSGENAAHIVLNKDGAEIAGGTVRMTNVVADRVAAEDVQAGTLDAGVLYSGTISADSITAGTLGAGDITIDGEFTVRTGSGAAATDCGTLGGGYAWLPEGHGWQPAIAMMADDGSSAYIAAAGRMELMRFMDACVYVTASNIGSQNPSPYAVMETANHHVAVTQSGAFYDRLEIAKVSPSDRRLKTDVDYRMDRFEAFFRALAPCSFRWKDGGDRGVRVGFVAQDVREALRKSGLDPDDMGLVFEMKKAEGDPDPTVYYALRYEDLVGVLAHMVRKLTDRADALEARIARLEERDAP